MLPSIWGPKYWFILHTSSWRYPQEPTDDDKKYMKNFIEALANLTLPCPMCRHHMREYLEKNSLDDALVSGEKLVVYLWKFHNHVNNTRGQPEMSFENFKQMMNNYELMKGPPSASYHHYKNPYLILLIILTIIFTIYYISNK